MSTIIIMYLHAISCYKTGCSFEKDLKCVVALDFEYYVRCAGIWKFIFSSTWYE